MNLRVLPLFAVLFLSISTTSAPVPHAIFRLKEEPLIRIGLETSARSVSIVTSDTQLVAVSPEEQPKFLETAKVSVYARSYQPPTVEYYYFDIGDIATREEADQTAKDVREATGEKAEVLYGEKPDTWRVRIGERKESPEEAGAYKDFLSEKGFDEAEMTTEKVAAPSDDAVALTQQLKTVTNTRVRSLMSAKPTGPGGPNSASAGSGPSANANTNTGIKNTVMTGAVPPPAVDPNLREVVVSGASEAAKFSSLKPVAFGSINERTTPVRVNGKAYRGRIEVFVNDRGSLTVVNVVALEDYLKGVVPNELGLPAIEAEKAQAVAARTYAVANINQFGKQGFDLLPTTRSQVYRGYSSESQMGSLAVEQTRGIVATYHGKPINAMYTSTCGGRTENSENIFEFAEPYLRGVECSLEGHLQFDPFLVKSTREPARIRDESYLELAHQAAIFGINGFSLQTPKFTDEWFEEQPTQSELSNWMGQLALRFSKPTPAISPSGARPAELSRILASFMYADSYADTLLSDSDVNYQLSFIDAGEIPKDARANIAALLRDGWISLYPDMTLQPNRSYSRAKLLRLILQIYDKKKWTPQLQTGTAQPSVDGKLVLKSGRTSKQLTVRPDVFLFRQFGDQYYQVKEAALIGGETVGYHANFSGEVDYLEIKPTASVTTAERMSSFTLWNATLSASAVQSRLSRYVRGIGTLYDVRIAQRGYSRRATDLEIIGSNGTFHLKGGKIRSALRLNEQLFVMNKRYEGSRAVSYSFTGRGWGHGVGMCQYGAYGLAKMGVKYDAIVKHYYTGIDLSKAY
jgi:stage II sporulation protein D